MTFDACRTLGHAWEPKTVQVEGSLRRLVLRCQRCDTERVDLARQSGMIAARRYTYVDGYRTVRGDEVPTRDEFRARLIATLLKGRKK